MLPYPSGDIHVGHVRNYCITDVIARYKRMRGFNVLHPIGWDASGCRPRTPPSSAGSTPSSGRGRTSPAMKRQLQRLGFSYPWSREIATCDAEYYRWNQWFFLRMLERGIAYRAKAPVNWCPSCQTVLANEQAEGGMLLALQERRSSSARWSSGSCASRPTRTQLLDDMAQLRAWPERVLAQQRNWIGKSHGRGGRLPGRRGRADPRLHDAHRHDLRRHLHGPGARAPAGGRAARRPERTRPRARTRSVGCARRTAGRASRASVEKEGVFTGRYATNPFTREKIPIWVGNFVLMGYGTGAIMSVPAHDQRDFEFARKYGLAVRVGDPARRGRRSTATTLAAAYDGPGRVVNSGRFDGLAADEAIRAHDRAGRSRRASARPPSPIASRTG